MTVAVEQDPARFYPLVTNDFHLTLIDSVIEATGWLIDPQTGTRVTQADITHSLDSGAGNAVLDVPCITFGPDYQPDELTRLTAGVVALVNGKVTGRGEIGRAQACNTVTHAHHACRLRLYQKKQTPEQTALM